MRKGRILSISKQSLLARVLPLILMVFLLALSNWAVQYPIHFWSLEKWATWGTIIYGFTYLVNDITNRFYGAVIAKQLIYSAMPIAIIIALFLPYIETRIALASGVAFLLSHLLDIYVFNRFRHRANEWQAPFISSQIANLIDTVSFYTIAFIGSTVMAVYFGLFLPLWVGWAMGDFLFKMILPFILLIPYQLFVRAVLSRQNASAL